MNSVEIEQAVSEFSELQAHIAFGADLDSLETEALIARSRYDDLRSQGLGY